MRFRLHHTRHPALAILLVPVFLMGVSSGRCSQTTELNTLISPAEREFLWEELASIDPPERMKDLAEYGRIQSDLGGGFYGMLPDQLTDADSIPVPDDETGRLKAALCLARQRRENRAALSQLNPDYVTHFAGYSLAEFLERMSAGNPIADRNSADLVLDLDMSALEGFFAALADGEITTDEAANLAALPSNQAMLQHRRNLGYVPEPLPDTESLATMIMTAGSQDPLDRLWCWLNSQNAFDYADLVQNADDYRVFLSDLDYHGDALVEAVVSRIAGYVPSQTRLNATFAMTVGWAIRGWVTPEMAGLNVEQTKDDWHFLFGTMVEETYHRLQLELFPTASGAPAREFSELVVIDTRDARYDRLFEIVTYTVAEGAANHVRGPFAAADLEDKVTSGAELMARFVHQVVDEGDLESADSLINEGLKSNGPLYGLGWKLAGLIAEQDGSQAVGEYQQAGPVRFFLHGASIAANRGEPLVTPEVVAAVEDLERRLEK